MFIDVCNLFLCSYYKAAVFISGGISMICVGIDAAKGKRCNAAISYAAKNPVIVICALRKSGQACRTAAAASEPGMKKCQGKQVLPGAKMSRKRSAAIEESLRGAGRNSG